MTTLCFIIDRGHCIHGVRVQRQVDYEGGMRGGLCERWAACRLSTLDLWKLTVPPPPPLPTHSPWLLPLNSSLRLRTMITYDDFSFLLFVMRARSISRSVQWYLWCWTGSWRGWSHRRTDAVRYQQRRQGQSRACRRSMPVHAEPQKQLVFFFFNFPSRLLPLPLLLLIVKRYMLHS